MHKERGHETTTFTPKVQIDLTWQIIENMRVFSKGLKTFNSITYLTAGQGLKMFERLLLD